jgi:hypothetical protein
MPKKKRVHIRYSSNSIEVSKDGELLFSTDALITPFGLIEILERLGIIVEYEESEEEV